MIAKLTFKQHALALARLVRKAEKRGKYNHLYFVGPDWKGGSKLNCGTVACALGWTTTMPELRRLGLRLNKFGDVILKQGNQYTDNHNFIARQLFGFSPRETNNVFYWGATGGHSGEDVANRIEAIVRRSFTKSRG